MISTGGRLIADIFWDIWFHSSDGNITKKELKKLFKDLSKMGNPDIGKATNAFFDIVDEDENGKINLDEFIEFCSGNEVFLQSLKIE